MRGDWGGCGGGNESWGTDVKFYNGGKMVKWLVACLQQSTDLDNRRKSRDWSGVHTAE